MASRPGPARDRLRIFWKLDQELLLRAESPGSEYHAALVTGDLPRVRALMDEYFQDTNMVLENHAEELEWQVKALAMFGLSGTCACLKLLLGVLQ